MFQPVSTSRSSSRTRAQNASSAAYSLTQRVAFSGIGRWPLSTIKTSSSPGAYIEIASKRSPFESVSMSNASTRGATVTSAGRSTGLSKIHVTPWPARRRAFDFAAALDAALDQVAHGEAHVRFERVDARGMQAVAQRWHVRRHLDFDSRDRLARERAAVDRLRRRHAQRACALRVGLAHIEMRPLAIVAHEERAAVFQAAVDLDDGNARAVRPVCDPVAGLQNEAARLDRHPGIVPLLCGQALA